MKQFVYVMKSAFGHCKVGVSVDPVKRMNAIRTGHGAEVSLIETYGPFNAATRLEGAVHRVLSERRMLGEWFDCDHDVVLDAVLSCLKSFVDDADTTEEEQAARDRMVQEFAKQVAAGRFGPEIQRWVELLERAHEHIDFYRSECKEWEANFIEANELLGFYADHAKHFSLIAQKAIDQVKRLEAQIAEMKSEQVAA